MDELLDDLDLAILDEVQRLHAVLDPVPDGLEERLKLALTVQALHAEVAELTQTPLVGTRGGDQVARTDTVTFSSGTISLMISTSDVTESTVTIDGWVTRGGARVEVQVGNVLRAATADTNGRFGLLGVPRGSAHFVVWPDPDSADDRPVVTPAIDV